MKIILLKDCDFQEKKHKNNILLKKNKIFKTTLDLYFKLKKLANKSNVL